MIKTPIQTALESVCKLSDPEDETLKFALVTIDLVMTVQIFEIDYSSDYRNALIAAREWLEVEIDRRKKQFEDNRLTFND